jgi:hypothetical protein
MAIIKVEAIKRGPVKEVMTVVDINEGNENAEPWWVATCTCGVSDTDRGQFEDTVQYAMLHVEVIHE